MAFIEKNWMLVVAFVASGLMLLWPLVQRRLSPVKEIGTLTSRNSSTARTRVLLDVRETNEFAGRQAAQRHSHPAVAAAGPHRQSSRK